MRKSVITYTMVAVVIVPVEIIKLNLHKIPFILLVMFQQIVINGHIAMEREAQIADAPRLTLLHQPGQQAIVEVAFAKVVQPPAAHGMQEQVVHIIGLVYSVL